MRVCIDLDKTLCTGHPYKDAVPMLEAKEFLSKLRADGHTIIIHTARGMGRSHGSVSKAIALVGAITFSQLAEWGFEYDELLFGKPAADCYIDDKAILLVSYAQVLEDMQTLNRSSLKGG